MTDVWPLVVAVVSLGLSFVASIIGVVWRFAVVHTRQESQQERITKLEAHYERHRSEFPRLQERVDNMRKTGGDYG